MKKYIVLIVFLFSAISSYAIIPPNPDICLECDNVPWTTGTLTFTYNYVEGGINKTCDIVVGFGYRFCNGAIDTYIDRLFLPPGSCYTQCTKSTWIL